MTLENNSKVYAVSACLLGENCKYNGGNNLNEKVIDFLQDKKYITICPESYGGLPCPREPSEITVKDGELRVLSKTGNDVTSEFVKGAEIALKKALENGCTSSILKARSPSCGYGSIYDGTFSGTLTDGYGIAARLFIDNNIEVITEEEL